MLNKINLSKGLTTIVKTTTNCNLNCIYCYEVKDNSNMDEGL